MVAKAKSIKAIEIVAEVRQLKSMADGSINLTLNLPERCKEQAKVLLDWLGLEVKAVIANDKKGKKKGLDFLMEPELLD